MTLSIPVILIVISIVLFILAALGVSSGRVNLTAAGLAFFAAGLLAGMR